MKVSSCGLQNGIILVNHETELEVWYAVVIKCLTQISTENFYILIEMVTANRSLTNI